MIKLQITKLEKNENYEEELKKFKEEHNGYSDRNFNVNNYNIPQSEVTKNILDVSITEEQFNAIRKAVLENF